MWDANCFQTVFVDNVSDKHVLYCFHLVWIILFSMYALYDIKCLISIQIVLCVLRSPSRVTINEKGIKKN